MDDATLILVRALHVAALISLLGSLAFRLLVAEPALAMAGSVLTDGERMRRSLRRIAWTSLIVAVLSGVAWLLLEAQSMSGLPLPQALSGDVLGKVLLETRFGLDGIARLALAIVLALALLVHRSRLADGIALVTAAGMLCGLAWIGRAGATHGGEIVFGLVADALHLLAAGIWLGGMLPLARLLALAFRETSWLEVARVATRRFVSLGVASIGVLLASGLANAWFLVSGIPSLLGTPYGQVLLLKLLLFAIMAMLAAVTRQRLLPALVFSATPFRALRELQWDAIIQALLGLAILMLGVVLGAMSPAEQTQVEWPLPFRLDVGALPLDRRTTIYAALAAIGLLLLGLAFLTRRRRWLGVVVGAGLVIGGGAPLLAAVLVKAYPTSFYRPREAYAAPSLVRGASLYAERCARCHGAGTLADVAAGHLFAESAGDLYWWISAGRGDVMPGLANVLDERQRWDVINFMHARAAATQPGTLLPRVTSGPAPLAPDFVFAQGGTQSSLRETLAAGPVLLVLYRLPAAAQRLQELAAARSGLEGAGLHLLALPLAASPGDAEDGAHAFFTADFAATTDADTAAAYALFAGGEEQESEFLIDRTGVVRARWTMSSTAGVADEAALRTELQRLAQLPTPSAW